MACALIRPGEIQTNYIMKTISLNTKSKSLLPLLVVATIAAGFTSCSKDKSASVTAYVKVTNSAEASVPQDFFIDNNKTSATAVAYGQSSDYVNTSAGNHQLAFKNTGTATVNSSFSASVNGNTYYDAFYVDGQTYTLVQDDRTAPQSGKARVRFINLSSAVTSTVDFGITGGSKLASAVSYKTASTYYDVAPASTFALYTAGSASVLLNIAATLQAGHIYTIYVSGATNATVVSHVITEE